MKRTLFLILLSQLIVPATGSVISVEGTTELITDNDAELSPGQTHFEHELSGIETGSKGGWLRVYYTGQQAGAKSVVDIASITGSGNLVLEGMSSNTLKLFRLAENATSAFSGNLSICNYSIAWDDAGIHDTAAVLKLGNTTLSGSLTLDVAGYCTEDSYFITAVGLSGDVQVGGLDAAAYIAPATYLYSGQLAAETAQLSHQAGLGSYITPKQHVLTIDTTGNHHFHGSVLTPVTILKKGSGTQQFTGKFAAGSSYKVQGGTLKLAADIEAREIEITNAGLSHTGRLSTSRLEMQDGQLSVTGAFTGSEAHFSGANKLSSSSASGTSWYINLDSTHRENAAITLGSTNLVQVNQLTVRYDKSELLRGWYQLIGNSSSFSAGQIQANNSAAHTEIRDQALWLYVADGEMALPRDTSATLSWQAATGNWETNRGHADLSWSGPETNSNFQAGDHVCFNQAATVTLVGELLPGSIEVSHSTGTLALEGSGSIAGSTALRKNGNGELRLSAANSFTGGTTLQAGTITTNHAAALGSGAVTISGGELHLSGQKLSNTIHIQGQAEIREAQQYAGQLVMNSGTLRGDSIHLQQNALLNGGEIATALTGTGGIVIQGHVTLSGASSYTGHTTLCSGSLSVLHAHALGSSTVIMQSGQLDLNQLNINNSLHIQGKAELCNAGAYSGTIDLQSGTLSTETLGSATLNCSGTATLQAESALVIGHSIHNTGHLTLQGSFDLSALGQSSQATLVDAYGQVGSNSGFQRDSGTTITLTTGSGSISGEASFLFHGANIELDSAGRCILGAATHYGQYHISDGHQVAVSDIRKAAGEKLRSITMNGGNLNADASATLQATGGEITLSAGTLSGSCSNCRITATGGVLALEFEGDNQVSSSRNVQITGIIRNSGQLTLQGELNASALPLVEQAATRTGGTSPASGYAQAAAYSVRVVSGGSVAPGATIIHGTHRLSLGSKGYATAGGGIDYSEYLLTGSDTARTSQLQHPDLQSIRMTGGTLTVDSATRILQASAGTVALAEGQLTLTNPSALSKAVTLTATGNSSLTAEGFTLALAAPIQNSGNLTLSGSFDATALAQSIAATRVDAYGNEGGSSGFLRDAGCKAQLITGGSLGSTGATILLHDKKVTPDSSGRISLPGQLHTNAYTITGSHSVSTSAIARAAGGGTPRIEMNSGTLKVDSDTNTLHACGGLVQVGTACLGGTLSDHTQVEIRGNAVLTSANTHHGGTTIATGSLRVEHAEALGLGPVHLGSRARTTAPVLDLGNLAVQNHLHLHGQSELRGLEQFRGSITMQPGAETTIQHGEVLNLRSGQTLTLAPGGNTIHGHMNLDGGTIIITSGTLTLNGVLNFSKPSTLDLSAWKGSSKELMILDFPSLYDADMLNIILPPHLQHEQVSFDPETGTLQFGPAYQQTPSLAAALNRNQRAAYEVLRGLDPADTTGALADLAREVADSTDVTAMRQLMDRVNGAGYTALSSSMADDALSHMQQLRHSAGRAHRLAPASNTAVALQAYNHCGSTDGEPGYDRSTWGGRLLVEQQVSETLSLGLALANGSARISPENDATHNDTATHANAYAHYANARWLFYASAGMGLHEFSLSRQREDGTTAEVEAVTGHTLECCVEAARSLKLETGLLLQPFLTLQAVSSTLEAFSESGSTAALHASKQTASFAELSLGLRGETTLADCLHLRVQGEITATAGDTASEMQLHFAEAPEHPFCVQGAECDTLGYRMNISLELPLSPACSLQADAAMHLQSHAQTIDSQIGILLHF